MSTDFILLSTETPYNCRDFMSADELGCDKGEQARGNNQVLTAGGSMSGHSLPEHENTQIARKKEAPLFNVRLIEKYEASRNNYCSEDSFSES